MKNSVSFSINKKKYSAQSEQLTLTLLQFLREDKIGLKGTKYGCGQGGCGACTVLELKRDNNGYKIKAINSCLTPVLRIDGSHILTIEGLSDPANFDHGELMVQDSMEQHNATQCGYCSPGFVVNMYDLLLNKKNDSEQAIENAFGGNLCRCTGYVSILKAMRALKGNSVSLNTDDFPDLDNDHPVSIQNNGQKWFKPSSLQQLLEKRDIFQHSSWDLKFVNGNTSSGIYDAKVDFPNFLVDISNLTELQEVRFEDGSLRIGAGLTYSALLEHLKDNEDDYWAPMINHIERIAGNQVRNLATLGGAITLVKKFSSSEAEKRKAEAFPSDFFVVALTYNAEIEFLNASGEIATKPLDELETLDKDTKVYLIKSLVFKRNKNAFIRTYRLARRTQNAHPIVNAGFHVTRDNNLISDPVLAVGAISAEPARLAGLEAYLNGKRIKDIKLDEVKVQFGKDIKQLEYQDKESEITFQFKSEIAYSFLYKFLTELFLRNSIQVDKRETNIDILNRNLSSLNRDEIVAPYYSPIDYSKQKGYADFELGTATLNELSRDVSKRAIEVKLDHKDVTYLHEKNSDQKVKKELSKIEGKLQVTGKANYVYDLKKPHQALEAYYVYSQIGYGNFHYTNAFKQTLDRYNKLNGSVVYISYTDIPNKNYEDSNFEGFSNGEYDPVFAAYDKDKNEGYVTTYGQPIGLVLSDSQSLSKAIAFELMEHIKFEPFYGKAVYEFNQNTIPQNSIGKGYHLKTITRKTGDEFKDWLEKPVDSLKNDSDDEIMGYQNVGAQIHFYMEPNVCLVIPGEDSGLEIYSSSQFLTRIQEMVVDLLNPDKQRPKVYANKIAVKTTRLGGGFGGKELRPKLYAGAAAIASHRTGLPVRLALDRETDSIMNGTRHPVTGKFKIQGDKDGTIHAFRVEFYMNIGNSWDCSYPVMELILLSSDGAYNVKNFWAEGKMYLSNIQSRTAFRSFGLIQCSLIREEAIEKFAHSINMRPDLVREKNFYRDATINSFDSTPYGQELRFCRINQVWKSLKEKADFEKRYQAVEEFNAQNKWKKRGISMIPIKYGISYTFRPYNFGNAYVFIYGDDASVMIHHGGIEMGQGIHTKLVQLAADELGIDPRHIRIADSSTDAIPNAASTGASTGSDLNGAAVVDACEQIYLRLIEFMKSDAPEPHSIEAGTRENFMKTNSSFKYLFENASRVEFKSEEWLSHWKKAWRSLVKYALISRVNLSAEGHYKSPGFGAIDPSTGKFYEGHGKRIFYYFTYSAAISEVEIDVLTGEFNILRTDIAYDAGISLNSKIDYGQVEGGFIQGVGYVTTENPMYDQNGKLITQNTWKYKPPCTKTIPEDFQIHLLRYEPTTDQKNAPLDTYGIQSSKSTGEPPLVLANSVFFAIKHAIMSSRKEYGHSDWVHIDAPLTVKRIFEFANCQE